MVRPQWLEVGRSGVVRAMSSLIDSEAAFKTRATDVGMNEELLSALTTRGFNTLSKYAFANQPPGRAVDDDAFSRFLATLVDPLPLAQVAVAKRLLFEAHTYLVHSLKEKVETGDTPAVRKINAAERGARLAAQAARLSGVRLKGELEVAHSVLDAVNDQFEKKQLKYIPPHKAIKREQEVLGTKAPQKIQLDASGSLTVQQGELHLRCDASSDLAAFHALQRRALAYDFCRLLSFDASMEWIHWLFDHLHREAAPGYLRPDLSAVLRADRQAWLLLAEDCTSFDPDPVTLKPPLDKLIQMLRGHPEVAFHLLPRPGAASKRKAEDAKPDHSPRRPASRTFSKGSQKGRDKSGKGGSRSSPPMPKQLLGGWAQTASGRPICFDFNLEHGCPRAKPGDSCAKGLHVCCVPHCQKPHGMHSHQSQPPSGGDKHQ